MVKKKIAKKTAKKTVAKKFVFDPKKHDLVLRTCNADMTAYGGFVWPSYGPVKAPDWKPNAACGNGLHGALWGEGNGNLFNWDVSTKWQVVAVTKGKTIALNGNVKFEKGFVIFTGSRKEATNLIYKNAQKNILVIGGTATVGDYGTATAGYKGTATAGEHGTATAGEHGTATAGYYGTATVGDRGTATAGYYGTATAGYYGTATAGYKGTAIAAYKGTATATVGDYGTATAGDYGTATAGDYGTTTAGYKGTATAGDHGTATVGDYGTATAGYKGTATVGDHGTATAGEHGTATAGHKGIIQISYWQHRKRIKIGYIGENGLLPNVKYKLNENFEFVKT